MTDSKSQRQARLDRYEEKTTVLMVSLAVAYIVLFATQVLAAKSLTPVQDEILNWISNAIWVVFVLDLIYRVYLAPHRMKYVVSHPIDVIAVILPAFRAFRVLRVFTAGQWLMTDGKRLTYGRTGLAIVLAVTMIVFLGALAELDAEQFAPNSQITNFGDALWFAFVTITTVGYGDAAPVTFAGKVVAVGIMLLGISLLGVVSATVATGFLQRIRGEERAQEQAEEVADDLESDAKHAALVAKLDSLESKVAELTHELRLARE